MKSYFHHVCNLGVKTIFREREDYKYFLNHLAVFLSVNNIKCLGYSIMATHVHMILITRDEEALKKFITHISRSYSTHFRKKYHEPLPKGCFDLKYSDEEEDFPSRKTKLTYVVRNPLKHWVTYSPLTYEFSSAKYVFYKDLVGEGAYAKLIESLTPVSKVSKRTLSKAVGELDLPGDYLYNDIDQSISPLSFVDVESARDYWGNNSRSFFYDVHTIPKDEKEEAIKENVFENKIDKYNDIAVCRIIDTYASEQGVDSFLHLNERQRSYITKVLLNKCVSMPQIERCLW